MKALVGAFNQEKALVGAFSVIVKTGCETDESFDEQFLRTGRCDFALSKENFFYEHVAFAFPKGSPWIPWFNEEIKLMLQSGMIIKWKEVRLQKLATNFSVSSRQGFKL